MTVVVFGGYGTFGAHAARALAKAGLKVRIAGRNEARAKSFAAGLGDSHEGIAADAADPASCARALEGARVAVSCAGPFAALPLALPEACLAAGAHCVDIADDRSWLARLRALDGRFRDRGLTAACGCSSLPGISGALALLAAQRLPEVRRARVTLFIGNRNPKGDAAVRSAAAQLGKTFSSPQGPLTGLRGRRPSACPSRSAPDPSTTGTVPSSTSSRPSSAPGRCGSRWDSNRASPRAPSPPSPAWGHNSAPGSSLPWPPSARGSRASAAREASYRWSSSRRTAR